MATKPQILAKIDQYLVENSTGEITALKLRELFIDVLASYIEQAEVDNSVNNVIASKADLVLGFVPDNQIPLNITRDTELSAAIAALVNSSPGALDTLAELSTALGNDPNFATTIINGLSNKLDKLIYVFLPKNGITTVDSLNPTQEEIDIWNTLPANRLSNKIIRFTGSNIATDPARYIYYADENRKVEIIGQPIQQQQPSDWNATSGVTTIQNKPTIFPPTVHGHTIAQIANLATALADKADLVGGLIADAQIPPGITRDSELSAAIAALVNASPATLDTLEELAAALGEDPNFATTISTALGNKIDRYNIVFISSATLTAVDLQHPTVVEIAAWNTANGNNRNVHVKYTGTALSTDVVKYVFYIDNSGTVVKLYGNKKVIFISESKFATLAGTLPTTTAASRTLVTATGVNYVVLSGAVNSINGCVFAMRVPDDYTSGGLFKVHYTFAAGSTLNFVLKAVITKMDNSSVSDGTAVTIPTAFTAETNSPRKDVTITPSLTFIPGEIIYVRLWREANDVGDTSLSNLFLTGCEFKYD